MFVELRCATFNGYLLSPHSVPDAEWGAETTRAAPAPGEACRELSEAETPTGANTVHPPPCASPWGLCGLMGRRRGSPHSRPHQRISPGTAFTLRSHIHPTPDVY